MSDEALEEEKKKLEHELLLLRMERKVIECIDLSDHNWIESKFVITHVKTCLPEVEPILSKNPKKAYDKLPSVMFRQLNDFLHVSCCRLPDSYYVKVHDRERELVRKLKQMRRGERKRKRVSLDPTTDEKQTPRKKRKNAGHLKLVTLEDACAMFEDPEFARELGVLNRGVKVKLDMLTFRMDRIQMVHPLKCWVSADEASLTPADIEKYRGMGGSDDESQDEELYVNELNEPKEVEMVLTNQVKVYKRRKLSAVMEIAILHKCCKVSWEARNSGGGWFRLTKPLCGWVTYEELRPKFKQEEVLRQKKKKDAAAKQIDLTQDDSDDNEKPAQPAAKNGAESPTKVEKEKAAGKETPGEGDKEAPKSETNGKEEKQPTTPTNGVTKAVNGKTPDTQKKEITETPGEKEEEIEMDTTPAKEKKETTTESAEKETPATEDDEASKKDDEEKEVITISDDDENCSDDDWEWQDDLDAETLTGRWSCGQKGGCFNLEHDLETQKLDGHLDDRKTCSIEGKVDDEKVAFNQHWQKASVHGQGVITVVKGTHSNRMRTMNVSFECTNSEGKKIHGTNTLYKDPVADISGLWFSQDRELGCFTLKMSEKGGVTGFLANPSCCKITGRLSGHHITFKQNWQVKTEDKEFQSIATTVEGHVNSKCSKMSLKYTHPVSGGKTHTGTVTLRKRTVLQLKGLWVSGDQGGRFSFTPGKGNKFTGYLDTNRTCRIVGHVDGFKLNFRQLWLSTSAHKGAVAKVIGKANDMFNKLDLTYRCEKKDGTEINGSSVLSKLEPSSEQLSSNSCFTGTHCAFPRNVFQQFQGFKLLASHSGENRFPLWSRTQKILVLGEADFSFTLALIREFKRAYTLLVGSSYMLKWGDGKPPSQWNMNPRKRQFLNESVRRIDPTLDEIVERGGICRFGVDARDLSSLYGDPHCGKWSGSLPRGTQWDRIIFPFPRASLSRWNPQEDTDLMRGTFRSAAQHLHPRGELQLILHTNRQGVAQFDLWAIRDIAESENMTWRAAIPFDPKKIPSYNPKDVTGTPWRPYEPRIHVFTPSYSDWRPESRLWR